METYAHAFFTAVLARHGLKREKAATLAGVAGAVLPDLPAFAATGYFVGPKALRDGWCATDSEEVLDAIYFTGPFGGTGSALHSAVPPALLLILSGSPRFRGRDSRGALRWFSIGWLGHAVADFLTHVDDVRPPFWPFSGWTWSSPISYYNPRYYGREFWLVEHGLMLLATLWLLGGSRPRTAPGCSNRPSSVL